MMQIQPSPKLVYVSWDDAMDTDETWMDESEVSTFLKKECLTFSVGWLLAEDDKAIVLSADKSLANGNLTHGRVTRIPKGMINFIKDVDIKYGERIQDQS